MERTALRHELHSNLKITVVELFDRLHVYHPSLCVFLYLYTATQRGPENTLYQQSKDILGSQEILSGPGLEGAGLGFKV